MRSDSIFQAATAYHEARLTVIPLLEYEKKPLGPWKGEQDRPQTAQHVRDLFPDDHRNIGLVGGICSDNLAVIDFDSMDSFRQVLPSPGFQRILSNTPTVRTARGAHVYLKTPYPVRNGRIPSLHLDIKATGGYVVAPPSLHPSGQRYMFERGFGDIYRLHAFDEIPFLHFEQTESERVPWYGIGWRLFSVLKGDRLRYPSRSEAEAALVLICTRNGWSFEEIFELFRRHATEGTKYRELGDRGAAYLYGTFKTGQEWLSGERREVDTLLDTLVGEIDGALCSPRTKWTDRAVARAVLEIARRAGKLQDLGLSVREVSELAAVDSRAAGRALARIPFLCQTSPATVTAPAQFKILLTKPHSSNSPNCGGMGTEGQIFSRHDAGRRLALGKTGLQIVAWLNANKLNANKGKPFLAAQVAADLGMHVNTVKRKLSRLAPYVSGDGRTKGRRYRLLTPVGERELDDLARRYGTLGTADRQRARHARERKAHRLALTRESWKACSTCSRNIHSFPTQRGS